MILGAPLTFPVRAEALRPRRSRATTNRFFQKLIVGSWAVLTGVAMVGWLVGLAWIGVLLIRRIAS
jgi:hypothetical protein